MTAFDLSGLWVGYAGEAAAALDRLGGSIPGAVRVNLDTGVAEVDADAVRRAVADAVPGRPGDQLAEGLIAYGSAGVVSLPGARGEPVAMPWLALEDLTYLTGGAAPVVREALGIARVRDGKRIAAQLHDRFPSLPDDVFTPPFAGLLAREPRLGRPGGGADPPDPPDPPAGHGDPPPHQRPIPHAGDVTVGLVDTSIDPSDVLAIAECILKGQWGPWWNDPAFNTGWIPGFKVCLTYDCADALGTYLLRFFAPSPTSLGTALAAGIKAGSAAAGVASMVSGFSMWVAVCTFLTGAEIIAVNSGNSKRGVCLYCSWPWIGIPIFAIGR